MITSVQLINYRCFQAADFTLAPLTALVGGNGSGKSSLLRALCPDVPLRLEDVWRHDAKLRCDVVVKHGAQMFHKWIRPSDAPTGGGNGYAAQLLALDLRRVRTPTPPSNVLRLDQDGASLVNVFASLSRDDQIAVSAALCAVVPLFHAVEHAPSRTQSGAHELRFRDRWDPKVTYTVDDVSDGTLLTFAFLVVLRQDPPPDLIVIEEPERGLHPYLLGEMISHLRKLTAGENGTKPVQVVMATHSAELVNHLQPDEVRFLRRDSTTGSVQVSAAPTDDPQWKRALQEYETLGSLWLSGGLGGVPGS